MAGEKSTFRKVFDFIIILIIVVNVGMWLMSKSDSGKEVFTSETSTSSVFSPSETSSSDKNTEETEKNDIPAPTAAGFRFYYNQLSADEKKAYDTIVENVSKGKTTMTLNGVQFTDYTNSLIRIVDAVTYDRPDFFWISGGFSYSVRKNINLTLNTYAYWKYTSDLTKYANELSAKVNEISQMAKAYPTDYEKALFVHDYIVEHTVYDHAGLAETEKTVHSAKSELIRSAYGCIINGKAVCAGYAKAYQLILCNLGIECSYVVGDAGGPHAWNYVKLDGENYYVDATWDDTEPQSGANYTFPNEATHAYFFITGAEISSDHTPDRVPFTPPNCNGQKYNYHAYKNYLLSSYSHSAAENVIRSQKNEQVYEIKFTNDAAYNKAESNFTQLDVEKIVGKKCNCFVYPDKRTLVFAVA